METLTPHLTSYKTSNTQGLGFLFLNHSECIFTVATGYIYLYDTLKRDIYLSSWLAHCHGVLLRSNCRLVCQKQVSRTGTTPFAKSNGRFFQTQKSKWCLHSICTILGRFLKCMFVVISYENYMDFWHQPVMHRGLKATSVFFLNKVWTSTLISLSEIWQNHVKFSKL